MKGIEILPKKTVETNTWTWIQEFMPKEYVQPFCWVGGMALPIGRQTSMDMFSHAPFDKEALTDMLKKEYHSPEISTNFFDTFSYILPIKTDPIFHPYKLIGPKK